MKFIKKGKQPSALILIHKDKKKVYKDVSDNKHLAKLKRC
ncbi:MAG: Unknown protein [uncultured Sulfurovum sp.]|uniref:Uncharacterized protein n=1 Tax=uncultured Sulfurovum sp. TaxID=269237 RepID=A0A6S6SD46_9BACT|nr:MAG: Unknown protein [uncultured Sulfurovum sp.]